MLHGNDEHAREIVLEPFVVEGGVVGGFESHGRGGGEMTLFVKDGVRDVRFVVIAREKNGGAEIDGTAPELRQDGALNFESLHILCVGEGRDWRDDFVADDGDTIAFGCIERELLRRAVKISGRAVPVLAFPLIVVHPDHVAVGAVKFGIDVDEGLHPIFAGRDFGEADDGRAEVGRVDDRVLRGAELFDIASEEGDADAADFESRLSLVLARKHDVDATGDGSGFE